MTYASAGDAGDIAYQCCTIKALGGEHYASTPNAGPASR
jgi:hypothetical protein